jgi:hypothetical protein
MLEELLDQLGVVGTNGTDPGPATVAQHDVELVLGWVLGHLGIEANASGRRAMFRGE